MINTQKGLGHRVHTLGPKPMYGIKC
jgi:hypothetical protein